MAWPRLDPRVARTGVFLLTFVVASGAHYLLRPYITTFVNRDMNASVAAILINAVTPANDVVVNDLTLGNSSASVQVAVGCDGLDALFMVIAAVLAFPMAWKRKLLGVLLGASLIYGLNVVRIAGLWYTLRYWPTKFDFMHETVGQTVLIFAAVLFFGAYTGVFGGLRAKPA